MRLRPLWGLTAAFLPALALLVALGAWQLERREWKLALIAAQEAQLSAPPVALEALSAAQARGESIDYRPVVARGRFDHAHELYLFRPSREGEGGYHVITPLLRDGKPPVLVDRGYVPAALRDPDLRKAGNIKGPLTVRGIARESEKGGPFTPRDEPEKRLFFARDVEAMAAAIGLEGPEPFFVEADATENPGGWPKGGQTAIALRNPHLGYALTWFGLAVVLIAVYLAYHRARGRLG